MAFKVSLLEIQLQLVMKQYTDISITQKLLMYKMYLGYAFELLKTLIDTHLLLRGCTVKLTMMQLENK